MNVLIEMTALTMHRPSAGAAPAEVARWYEQKARLHEYLAGEGGPDSARERLLARSAHARSARLLGRHPV